MLTSSNISQVTTVNTLKCIFVLGTAGSGKSLLTSKLYEYYASNGAFAAILNLDPGVESLPYTPDMDVRDRIDILSIMRQYDLGPNGALVMANDMIASQLSQLQTEIDAVNPDYLIVDTPGQIELFAYRSSGPFLASELNADSKTGLFLFDGAMAGTPANFISLSMLSLSIRLRLQLPFITVLSKSDLSGISIDSIIQWATDITSALDATSNVDGETYSLISTISSTLNQEDYAQDMIPVSSATGDGLVDLESSLSRMLLMGEEVED